MLMPQCAGAAIRRCPRVASGRPSDAEIENTLRALLHLRGAGKTICPSEVARQLSGDWRALMPDIRRIAARLPDIHATQRGDLVDPEAARGPIRLGLAHSSTPPKT